MLPLAQSQLDGATTPRSVLAPGRTSSTASNGFAREVLALVLALGAESLGWLTAETVPLDVLGMVLAAGAILLSGLSTYRKGWAALRRGELSMSALMGIAVTGAFLIGQWPEAAMVMALFAIAERIEARSAARSANAAKTTQTQVIELAYWEPIGLASGSPRRVSRAAVISPPARMSTRAP
jgi:cation transport ATPase